MIAVRLSAQCTDARVNLVTPALFSAFPTLKAMAAADIGEVEKLVHSCGFYKHKARDIVLACQMLLSDYGGKGAARAHHHRAFGRDEYGARLCVHRAAALGTYGCGACDRPEPDGRGRYTVCLFSPGKRQSAAAYQNAF